MFSKSMLSTALALASLSVLVESFKVGGPSMFPFNRALANFAGPRDTSGSVPCFIEFSTNQASTVEKMDEEWGLCRDTESRENEEVTKDLRAFTFEIAKIQNDVCVRIDNDCRNKLADDGDVLEALKCFEETLEERAKIIEIGEDCRLKILDVENANRLIIESRKNCTNNANIAYLKKSDLLFEKVISTCENAIGDISSTVSPGTQAPIRTTTERITDVTSTTEAAPDTTTEEAISTTRRRFPWN